MTDRELLEKIFKKMGDMDSRMTSMETEMADIKADVKFTKETVIKIENDHGQKLNALFDGHSLIQETERIENG